MGSIFIKRSTLIAAVALLSILGPLYVDAQIRPLNNVECGFFGVVCPPNVQQTTTFTLSGIIYVIIQALLILVGVTALAFLIYAGIRYITALGNEETIRSAKTQITFTLIGIFVIMLAESVVLGAINLNFTQVELNALTILQALVFLVGVTALAYLIYAGVRYITSQGDEEQAATAKRQIAFTLVGIFVIMLARSVVLGALNLNFTQVELNALTILQALVFLVGVTALAYLIYAGVKYITSQGDEEQAATAKRQITYALIGIFVIMLAESVVLGALNLNFTQVELNALTILNALLVLIGVIATAYLVYAGALYITSQGDEEQAEKAKRQIAYAVLGLFVVMLAGVIVNSTLILNYLQLAKSINTILNALLVLIGVIATAYLVYAGALYITSQGDEEQAEKAKRQIAYAIIGLFVVMLAGLIVYGTRFLDFVPLAEQVNTILNALLVLIGVVATAYLVYAGALYITSQGDEERAESAKRQIAYAVLGIIVVGLAAAIVNATLTINFGPLAGDILFILNALLILIAITATIFLIYAGVTYIMSTGEPDVAQRAKQQIIYAVIGLVVIGLAAAVVNVVITAIP